MPSVILPDGISVLPVPAVAVLYTSIKLATSPVWIAGNVVGNANALVLPSYVLVFVAAVTVIANAVIRRSLAVPDERLLKLIL